MLINRRSLTLAVCLAIGAALIAGDDSRSEQTSTGGLSATPGLSGSRPNIVVVMADDLDVTTTRAALALNLMPNLAAYISDPGTTFTESYVTQPLCCPSRATFLTGQYTHNHHTHTNVQTNGSVLALDDTSTLATWLQEVGYRTAYIGKYLNGYGAFYTQVRSEDLEEARAIWDDSVGIENRMKLEKTYVPPGWDSWYGLIDFATYCVYNYAINENGVITNYLKNGGIFRDTTQVPPGENYGTADNYQTDILARRAMDFLLDATSTPEQPFFLNVMPLAPHIETCNWSNHVFAGTPAEDDGPIADASESYKDLFGLTIRPAPRHAAYVAPLAALAAQYLPLHPSFNEADLSDKPQELQDKLALLNESDKNNLFDQFAHRFASLLAVDDLIGAIALTLEARGQLSNTVLIFTSDNGWFHAHHRLASKDLGYEEAIRVPLFIRTPSGTNQVSPRVVLNNDLALTIADLAGATPSIETDGRSLLPLLANPNTLPWRRQFLFEHYQSLWPDHPSYHLYHSSLLGIKTTTRSPVPNRVYMQYYPGVQHRDGYYLNPPPENELGFPTTPPDLPFVWQAPVVATELYDMVADRYQLENLLYDLDSRPEPERQQIEQDQSRLQQKLMDLVACQGDGCRAAEDLP